MIGAVDSGKDALMAKVKSVETSAELQSLLEKSGLLDENKLEPAGRICSAADTPKNAARQLIKEGLLTNWQANQLLGGFYALTMGNYRLLDQIGKGELGRVYLAQHSKMGNKVALKALASKSASDPKMVERFLEEARIAGAFEHQNVLRVLDVASDRERPFVVTEFVSGGDLQQKVEKGGPLSPKDAAALILHTAEGMSYVHSKNVLHRDLKPANLLVDVKGVVKILDVGVGQLRQSDKTGSENTGELLLSALGYMSPEQVRSKELDARSDIYALGGTLYFLMTARVPYTAVSNEERDVIRNTKRPVPVTSLRAGIPPELASLCDQMMALKPSDRPASMEDVAEQLRKFLTGEATEVTPDFAETAAAPEPSTAADVAPDFTETTEPKPLSDTVHQVGSDTVPFQGTVDANLSELVIENDEKLEPELKESKASIIAEKAAEPAIAAAETFKITVDGAMPAAAPVVPEGFKIQKKKKSAIAESIAAGAEPDSPLALVAKKSKRQRMILIGTVAASLVIILISVGLWMLSSSDEPQVAKNDSPPGSEPTAASPAAAATTAVSSGLDPNDPENIPDPENTPNPPATAATVPSTVAPEPATAGTPGQPAIPAAAPTGLVPSASPAAPAASAPAATPGTAAAVGAGAPPAIPASPATPTPPTASAPTTTTPPTGTPAVTATPVPVGTPAAGSPAPASTTAATAAPTTPIPAATAPVTAEPAPATAAPAPATPAPAAITPAPAPATAPAATKKAEPVTESPKKAPAAPPKSAKTFEIAAAVDLPRLPAADGSATAEAPGKVLGKVNIDEKATCFVAMYGGDKAMKGRNQFTLRNAQSGTAPRDWEIVQKDATGTETVIATLALPAQELKFEWTAEGLKNPAAGALRNCALKITAGQEKPHFVALRTVQLAPPMATANVEKSALMAKFPLDAVPDGSGLRIEPVVPGLKIVFDAGGADVTKGDQWIYFGENKEQAPLVLKLDTSTTAKGMQISALSYVLLPNEKPQKLTPALRKKLSVADMQRQATMISGKLAEMKKLKKEDQAKLQNEMNLTGVAQRNLDELIQRVQKLDELIQQLNNNGKIHFRIFYDAGETQIDLVRTDDNAPPVK